jgi:F-type H+-transporting ATPase subunit gamma
MAKARAIVQRRQSVQNIKKITRTMELIATARFKKALDRATEAEAYTRKIAEIVADLGKSDLEVTHPLLETRPHTRKALVLVITSNRGLAGGYNGNVLRVATRSLLDFQAESIPVRLEIAGKRGINFFRFRGTNADARYTHFEDRPQFDEVDALARSYISMYVSGEIDRLDVVYTRFVTAARQEAIVETMLPMSAVGVELPSATVRQARQAAEASASKKGTSVPYEFLPDARSILEEIVPVSFKVRLFKCFLDAAVSEQIARMVAMRGATENADEMVKSLTMLYNRARQAQITRELAEIIGGAAALE